MNRHRSAGIDPRQWRAKTQRPATLGPALRFAFELAT
jgi:hypothetical protein